MTKKKNKLIDQKIAEAKKSEGVLPSIESALSENLKCAILSALIKDAEGQVTLLESLESQIESVKEKQKATLKALNDFQKRLRSGAKSVFGDDSLEFERVGGKRMSERKKRTKKSSSKAA